ncbi:MAG: hypothetical protein ACFE8E_13745 [Candidatus Hodarchaeota archaeon]
MVKHYKNEKIMKFLVIIGGLVGLVYIISGFASLANLGFIEGYRIIPYLFYPLVVLIIGLGVVIVTLLVGIRPNNPIPFHWLLLFIFGVLLAIFGAGIIACLLVIIAAIIGLIEEL